jgi:AcrR family transcriptional regulator
MSTSAARTEPAVSLDPRYQRLLAATREAAERGYDAVQMRELAAVTRMSLATIYQFCSSKDQLITAAHVDWMARFRDDLTRRRPRGNTAAERVSDVLEKMSRSLEQHRELILTILRALYSAEPEVEQNRRAVSQTYVAIIDAAIGDEPVPSRQVVIETLGRVVSSVLFEWAHSGLTAREAGDTMRQAASLLLAKQ